MVIKRVQPLPVGKMFGATYAVLGLLFGLVLSVVSLAFGGFAQTASRTQGFPPAWWAGMFGAGAVIVLPIFYGAVGFIGGIIGAAIYNAMAKAIGGIVIEVE